MSEAQFTPGPWAQHSWFKEYVVPADHAKIKMGGADDDDFDRREFAQEICRIVRDRHGRGTVEANGPLIAAAPTMYAALESARTFVSDELDRRKFGASSNRDPYIIEATETLAQIDAALAAARGEQGPAK